MRIKVDLSTLKQTRWHEYLLRFVLGGLVTAAAGLVARRYGPSIGGLFLAFPAILPASVTLIAKHERERKAQHGLHGDRRGLEAAAIDAAGSILGSLGLAAFACLTWWLIPHHGSAWVLPLAALTWFVCCALVWRAWRHRHWRRSSRRDA